MLDLVVIGGGPAALAAIAQARASGARVAWIARDAGLDLAQRGGGWQVRHAAGALCARRVLLAGAAALDQWRAAGGQVVHNPTLDCQVPAPGSLPGVGVAGAALGVRGTAAQAKSGRFRARKLLAELASGPLGAIRGP